VLKGEEVMEGLKPCPFCGSDTILIIENIESQNFYNQKGSSSKMHPHTHWYVGCCEMECKISPRTPDEIHTREEAVTIWNTRKE